MGQVGSLRLSLNTFLKDLDRGPLLLPITISAKSISINHARYEPVLPVESVYIVQPPAIGTSCPY